jgi:tRNA(Ile)-lysidine synthase
MNETVGNMATYLLGISGGVDSMVLLSVLTRSHLRLSPELEKVKTMFTIDDSFIVAHFDHGIRDDSHEDALFVEKTSTLFGLTFASARANLKGSSEETARTARRQFLVKTAQENSCQKIVLAHHLDDVVETALLNLRRGISRKGLTSIYPDSGSPLLRPLLGVRKEQLMQCAVENGIEWREDSTNRSNDYSRNVIRHSLASKFSGKSALYTEKIKLLESHLSHLKQVDVQIEATFDELFSSILEIDRIPRNIVENLEKSVFIELFAHWLRRHSSVEPSRVLLEMVAAFIPKATTGKHLQLRKNVNLVVEKKYFRLEVAPKNDPKDTSCGFFGRYS